jgi:hypothetical protein
MRRLALEKAQVDQMDSWRQQLDYVKYDVIPEEEAEKRTLLRRVVHRERRLVAG